MKRKFVKKSAAAMLTGLLLVSQAILPIQADDTTEPVTETTISDGEDGIMPLADHIVWVYREYNGKLQKRRYNQTTGYWVDPYWITVQ